MSLTINLLGRPRAHSSSDETYQFRSRKSWAVLAFILLSPHPPTRSRLASLLFSEANDPLRALRWSLSEIRRILGPAGSLEGDPIDLRLPAGSVVDVNVATRGTWVDAVDLVGLGADLLEGIAIQSAPAFETWLLSEQRHIAAASEAILHEAALGSMSRGDNELALGYASRAAVMSPLDENHQALLIRLYRLIGDDAAAEQQLAACTEVFAQELGVAPGPAVEAAFRERSDRDGGVDDPASVAAVVEAGTAAVAAGAVEAGVRSLRTAVGLADGADATSLRVSSRLVLAEALIHSLRGLDEEGMAALHEAAEIALASGDRAGVAQARAELGYVDFLRARYDRSLMWLTDALEFADGSVSMQAKAKIYLGSVESDRANYTAAIELLDAGNRLARAAAEPRREAYGLSILGRLNLLRGDLDRASEQLDASIDLAEGEHWLAFLPWPQALRGEVQLAQNDPDGAEDLLRQAFARACQLGDPCWEGMSARGLALVAEQRGDVTLAFELLDDARSRCNRLADPYVWLDGYIFDAQCTLGLRHDHPDTGLWIDELRQLASRTGMRELTVRSLLYGAQFGDDADAAAASLLGAEVDNPVVHRLIASVCGEHPQ